MRGTAFSEPRKNVSRETRGINMKCSEKYTVTITGTTSDGEGVARVDGEVVFVPRAIEGETVEIQVVNVGRSAAHGVIKSVKTPSPHRIEPDCPYFGSCGGCDFRHMDYAQELEIKRRRVADALARIGGIRVETLPITGSETQEGYRNKVQFPVAVQKGAPVAGFYRARTHEVISAAGCKLQPECAERLKAAVLSWMQEYKIPAYDEKTHTGLVRHIYLRYGFVSGQALCCVVLNAKKTPHAQELVKEILRAVPETASIVVSYNEKRGNTVLGDQQQTLYGPGTIEDTLCELQFRLSPRSFYQINHDQAEKLYAAAVRMAGLQKTDSVLDLYCGAGTITLCLAREAGQAYGVEVVDAAIADAKENAARNGITNAEFFCADAGQAAQEFARRGVRLDVIVVDPPRKGVSGDVIEAMLQMAPRRIVYVSCDPATLARDVKLLCAGGYALTHAEAFDLFPRCAHVETVVLLSRETKPLTVEVRMEVETGEVKEHPTYKRIQEYVQEKYGFKVHTAYIAEVERMVGLDMHKAPNAVEQRKHEYHPCPPEKVEAIKDALRHFGLISE